MSEQGKRQVLPTNVRPTHYTLTFTPDFVKFTFVGTEVVNININEKTSSITLHSKNIDIKSAKLVSSELKTAQSFEASKISYDAQKETATLTFPQELASGTTASLHVEFTGVLDDKMSGFYKSSYKDKDGNTRYMAATQFEATEARRAFPSWDEPAIKATFDIILIVPTDMTALSNMNVIGETQHGDGKKEVKFAKTPIMSTYLVAFIVGDLGYVETSTTGRHNNGKPVLVRVYAPKGHENHGEFSLNVAAQVLEYFAEVFDIPYPLPKCDMVAVPDFEFGAMENWGLITYRMTAILYDPKASDAKFKERVAYTVSHELAHQWFGNLVTMEWWDHLWLNEGFATWVGYLAVDKIFPDWNIWTKFINEGLQQGLELDSLRSSHPIEVPVNDPSEIHQIFDAISYYKGASVIRMLSAYLGEDVFLSGVRRYLKRHKFSNASTGDLWKALTEESGVDVSLFMTGWTRVVGYPVLTVEEPAPGALKIRQCRFLSSEIINPEEDNTTWWVPLGIDLGSDTPSDLKSTVLTQKEITLKLPPRESDFYVLNARKAGVFRVNYTPERLSKLGKAAKLGSLDISDRVGIMGDAGALAISGHGKTSGLLSFIKEFGDEDKFIVWCEIESRLTSVLDAWFEQPAIQKGLNAFSRQLSSKLVAKLGWEYSESEDYLTSRLRTLVIKLAGSAGDPDVIKEAHRRFNLFTKQNDESALHPNVRGTVYEIVLSHGGGKEEFEAILKNYREAKTADQKVVALSALGFAQGDLIQRALQFSLCEEVRDQDVIYILLSLKKNLNSRKPLWEFFKNNWNSFNERFGESALLFGRMVDFCFGSLSSDDDIADIEKFFANKDCKVFKRNYQQSLERVRTSAAWVKRDSKDIEDWLKANGFLE